MGVIAQDNLANISPYLEQPDIQKRIFVIIMKWRINKTLKNVQ